jgi:hypothetical protein
MKQPVTPGLMAAVVVVAVLIVGAVFMVWRSRNPPLAPAVGPAAAAPERNIPRPGQMPGGFR